MRTYLRLFRFALPYRWRFAGRPAGDDVLAAANSLPTWSCSARCSSFLFSGGNSSTADQLVRDGPPLAARGRTGWTRPQAGQLLTLLPFMVIGVSLVKGVAFFVQSYLMSSVSAGMVADLRCALFDRLVVLSPSFHTRHHSGDLLSRFNQDVAMVQLAVTEAISSYLRDGITVIWMLVTCFVLDWKMSLIAFGAIPATLFPVIRMAQHLRRTTGQSAASLGKISEIALETLGGIRVVQAFGMERYEQGRFRKAIRVAAPLRAGHRPAAGLLLAAHGGDGRGRHRRSPSGGWAGRSWPASCRPPSCSPSWRRC